MYFKTGVSKIVIFENPEPYMFFLLLLLISAKYKTKEGDHRKGRIMLKLDRSDKFLVVGSDDKLRLGDYREAVYLRLNTMDDISQKTLEGRDNKALTETGFWFFPKSYLFKSNTGSSRQAFRIVYHGPNEYILMKGDSCLGFNSSSKFKKVDCKRGSASIFNICSSRSCDNYIDIRRDLECIKMMLSIRAGGRYRNGYDDESSDDSSSNRDFSRNGRYPKNRWGGNLKNDDDSDDDDYMRCKEFVYGGSSSNRHHPNGYDPKNRYGGRGAFDLSGIMSGNHLGNFGYGRPGGSFRC